MNLSIIKSGLLTTIQDTGRYGYQKEGIIASGAMDNLALRIANILVGNREGEAAIETTLHGPSIHFENDCLIAITGGNLSPTINSEPVDLYRPVYIKKDSLLEFGSPVHGCRSYIALSGGFDIPKVVGSYSTYLQAKIGGFYGRPFQKGDTIPCKGITDWGKHILDSLRDLADERSFIQSRWAAENNFHTNSVGTPLIRIIKCPEYELFSQESKLNFWKEPFTISAQSNRMGYRLEGPALSLYSKNELLSSAVSFGTIQVPPNGKPIILMADHQTTGGYPRIGVVASADFSILAQLAPGKAIRFSEISLEEAQQLYMAQEQGIEKLKLSVHLK